MYNTREEKNALIDRVNQHNRYCLELIDEYDEEGTVVDEERFEQRRRESLETGIVLCCQMRTAGFEAVLDRLLGSVVDGKKVDLTETIDDGSLRYFTFEWADTEEAN